MGSKNISIPDEVYERLREERRADESFGDTIDRLLTGRPLSDFVGTWSDETADRASAAVAAGRERNTDRFKELFDE